MRIHCLQHVEIETPGYIGEWAAKNNYSVTYTKYFDQDINYPLFSDFDWLLIMGGPMGVYEEDKYPWLIEEKKFIKESIDNNKVVLGVCLGAQLIASALGSNVYKNKFKEIGWFPVELTPEAKINKLFSALPDKMTVFHWHGDTFDLPEGSVHIAKSDGAENQAFVYNERVVGLQFHFEITEKIVTEWMENENLQPDKYVQTKEYIVANAEKYADADNKFLITLLENLKKLN